MKQLLTAVILFFICMASHAQTAPVRTAKYSYDAAGNRVGWKIIYLDQGGGSGSRLAKPVIKQDKVGGTSITMSPNPTEGLVNIKIETHDSSVGSVNVEVYDFSGRLLISKLNIGEQAQLDMSNFPSGSYRMRLLQGTKESTWKIIKL